MGTYGINMTNAKYFGLTGRIIRKDGKLVLGYTNSSVEMLVQGTSISADLETGDNDPVNQPGLRIYVDGMPVKEIVLTESSQNISLASFDEGVHRVKIVKITEAAMSYVAIKMLYVDGMLLPVEKDTSRKKAQFIGDSISCGFGVLGEPEQDYSLRLEDGEKSYAAFLAEKCNWEAEWVSVSGYGMFVEYTGDRVNVLPNVYPYTNYFYDKEEREDYTRFVPDYIFINLGTNDGGHLNEKLIKEGFESAYENFLYTLRMAYDKAAIICVAGTLDSGVFKYVAEVVEKVRQKGFENVYAYELPYHDTLNDGVACGHPTEATHKKDADRIYEFMKREGLI
ncbi:MAG: hypothetical protein J5684_00615 [Eubacterium sp.]|nr:hypothetical protein [Eubacterium sp.]